jgi:hypothetical protein
MSAAAAWSIIRLRARLPIGAVSTSRRNVSVARLTAALPLSVDVRGSFAARLIAATSATRRAVARTAAGLWQDGCVVGCVFAVEPQAAGSATHARSAVYGSRRLSAPVP